MRDSKVKNLSKRGALLGANPESEPQKHCFRRLKFGTFMYFVKPGLFPSLGIPPRGQVEARSRSRQVQARAEWQRLCGRPLLATWVLAIRVMPKLNACCQPSLLQPSPPNLPPGPEYQRAYMLLGCMQDGWVSPISFPTL